MQREPLRQFERLLLRAARVAARRLVKLKAPDRVENLRSLVELEVPSESWACSVVRVGSLTGYSGWITPLLGIVDGARLIEVLRSGKCVSSTKSLESRSEGRGGTDSSGDSSLDKP